jgi:hypothetical protein
MRILVVGDGRSKIHEVPVAEALRDLGHQVETFFWNPHFYATSPLVQLWLKMQNRFLWGPQIGRINRELVGQAAQFKPDLVFVYRGTHVLPSTIRAIKARVPGCQVFGYNNDDPFSTGYPGWLWRHFLKGLPAYDLVLAYRHRNLEEYRRAGARRVELLRSWFVPRANYAVELSDEDKVRYACDVVFIGHYEPDQRVAALEAVVRRGWKLRLFGPGYDWDPVIRHSSELTAQTPVQLVWGEDYNRALCGARIALCFLSKLNRDTYTRRCFEIPATRTLMLAEYTDDLARLFREGEEAEFFRTPEEMLNKIERYLKDDGRRKAVAEAGFKSVHQHGHDVVSRMRQVLLWSEEIRKGSR